jgi:hypothetical protein
MFQKEKRRISQTRYVVKLTLKQFELFQFMIERIKGDSDNGCEGLWEYKRQIEQLFQKYLKGKLLSR